MTESSHSETRNSAPHGRWPVNGWKPISVWSLASKELRETLRDRRTILTLFLMPILVYPILSLLFQGFLASSLTPEAPARQADPETGGSAVTDAAGPGDEPFAGEAATPPLKQPAFLYMFENEEALNRAASILHEGFTEIQRIRRVPGAGEAASSTGIDYGLVDRHGFEWLAPASGSSLVQVIENNEADVGIILHYADGDDSARSIPGFELIYRDDVLQSVEAVRLLEGVLDAANIKIMNRMISSRIRNFKIPYRFNSRSIATAAAGASISFTALIPLILTLMTITGAVYPAIDLTAGERERGTLESLVAAPIPRMRILLGKLVAVVAVSMLTAVVNLAGMTITIWVFRFDTLLFGEQGLTLVPVLKILALLVLFAGFFASVLLVITSFAQFQGGTGLSDSGNDGRAGTQPDELKAGTGTDRDLGHHTAGQHCVVVARRPE